MTCLCGLDLHPGNIDALAALHRLDRVLGLLEAGAERLAKYLDRVDLVAALDLALYLGDLERPPGQRGEVDVRVPSGGRVEHLGRDDNAAPAKRAFLHRFAFEFERRGAGRTFKGFGHNNFYDRGSMDPYFSSNLKP